MLLVSAALLPKQPSMGPKIIFRKHVSMHFGICNVLCLKKNKNAAGSGAEVERSKESKTKTTKS